MRNTESQQSTLEGVEPVELRMPRKMLSLSVRCLLASGTLGGFNDDEAIKPRDKACPLYYVSAVSVSV